MSQRYEQQTGTILNTPGWNDAITSRIAQAFQTIRQIQQKLQQRSTGGPPTNVFQVHIFAVRDPTTNRDQNFDRQDLATFGLGKNTIHGI